MDVTVQIESSREVLARHMRVCGTFWGRLKGLLGTSDLAKDEACLIRPCSGVHTWGMKYAIDVYFLNRANKIVSVIRNMKPNRFRRWNGKLNR